METGFISGTGGGNLGTLFVQLTADVSKLVQGMNKAEDAVTHTTHTIRHLIEGLAVGELFKEIINEARKFEDSFVGVRESVHATEAEFKQLEIAFRGLSKEIPVSVEEINHIAESAGRLGVPTKDVVEFTKVIAELGTITNLSGETAAAAFVHLANVTGVAGKDFERMASTVVALGKTTGTSASEITETARRIAGTGTLIHLTTAQILSFSAAMRAVGVDAGAGGMVIEQTMIRMSKAASAGGKELVLFAQAAGMSGASFKELFDKDATEAILRFLEGLKAMDAKGQDVIVFLEKLGLDGFRVADNLLKASAAGDILRNTIGAGTRAWAENNALTETAAARYATFTSQLTIAWNQIKDLMITIGQQLIPVLKALIAMMQDTLKGSEDMGSGFQKFSEQIAPKFLFVVGLIGDAIFGWKLIFKAIEGAVYTLGAIVLTVFDEMLKGIAFVMNKLVNTVIDGVNIAIKAVDKILPKAAAIKEISFKLNAHVDEDVTNQAQAFRDLVVETAKEFNDMAKQGSFSDRLQEKYKQVTAVVVEENKKIVEDVKKTSDAVVKSFEPAVAINDKMLKAIDEIKKASLEGTGKSITDVLKPGGTLSGFEDPALSAVTKLMEEKKQAEEHLKTMQEINALDLNSTAEFTATKLALLTAYHEKVKALQQAETQLVLGTATKISEDMLKIAEGTAGKQSAIYKTAFAASKAFALAEAVVKIQQGIASAASLTWPANLVAMASVVAATASIVSTIQSAKLEFGGGKAAGGPVSPGRTFLVGEQGPELFSPSQRGNIIPNDQLGGGSNVKVIVNNFTDAGAQVTERNEGGERVIEVMIKRVKNEIGSEIRDGRGDVTKAMETTFNLRRGK